MGVDEILQGLWRRRGRLLLAGALFYALAGGLVWLWPSSHVARLVVAPAETTGIAASSLLSSGALLPPALLDQRPSGNFAVYLAALRTPEAARALAADTPILADLDTRREAAPLGPLRRALGLGRAADQDDVQGFLERNLAATPSLTSLTWTIELVHRDRALALAMLTRLHEAAEQRVRDTLADLAARRIAALQARLAVEADRFQREALHALLAQQQRSALVVEAEEAAAARLISPPSVSLRPTRPNRPLLLALLLPVMAPLTLLGGAAVLLWRRPPARPVLPSGGVTGWAEAPLPRREPVMVRSPSADGA